MWINLTILVAVACGGLTFENFPSFMPGRVPADRATIERWIADLDSDRFARREEATRQLWRCGLPAVEALAKAADGERPEVTHRAVLILKRLCQSPQADVIEAAHAALEELAESHHQQVARRAVVALRTHRLLAQRRAIAAIEGLGGTVYVRDVQNGESIVAQAVLGRAWKGGDAGLKHLKWLTGLEHLGMYGPQFTDGGVKHLQPLSNLRTLQLFGTQLSVPAEQALRAALPATKVDCRLGGFLGVSGVAGAKGCQIQIVQPGSAADDAGLRTDDVITQIDDKAIADFEGLVATIARKRPGDSVRIELDRSGESLVADVELGALPFDLGE